MRSEMCSLHLTHPSVHTWSSGQPTVQRPGSSRGIPVGSGGSRGGARGAPAPAEIWLAPEVPLSCHSSGIYVSVKSFEIQPVQRKLYM